MNGEEDVEYSSDDLENQNVVETEVIPEISNPRTYTDRMSKRKFMKTITTTMEDELEGSDVDFVPENEVAVDERFESDEEETDDDGIHEVEKISARQFHEGMKKSFKGSTSSKEVRKIKIEQANHSLKLLDTLWKKLSTPLPKGSIAASNAKQHEMDQLRESHISIASSLDVENPMDLAAEQVNNQPCVYEVKPTSYLIEKSHQNADTVRCRRSCKRYLPFRLGYNFNSYLINNFDINEVYKYITQNS